VSLARQPVPRTQVRRSPHKERTDRAELDRLLSAALVAHVAVVDDEGQPYVLPMALAPDGDRVLLHGSSGSRLMRGLAAGAPTCVTVTALDALVLARSQFESSMRYRSAMLLGRCTALAGEAKAAALDVLTEHLMPGRAADARPASAKELAATTVLALPLVEWSLKVSDGGPDDDPSDLDRAVWAGIVPLERRWGSPVPSPDLDPDREVPGYLGAWADGRG
jgi:nitroimidazol reductase NimA-like FMN-containing flavoprotein (pyridoxamine 5'-phosphate oxidase superfamily)